MKSSVSAYVTGVCCDCPMTSALIDPLDDDRFSGSSTYSDLVFDYSFAASRMSTWGSENVWMAATNEPGEYIQVWRNEGCKHTDLTTHSVPSMLIYFWTHTRKVRIYPVTLHQAMICFSIHILKVVKRRSLILGRLWKHKISDWNSNQRQVKRWNLWISRWLHNKVLH